MPISALVTTVSASGEVAGTNSEGGYWGPLRLRWTLPLTWTMPSTSRAKWAVRPSPTPQSPRYVLSSQLAHTFQEANAFSMRASTIQQLQLRGVYAYIFQSCCSFSQAQNQQRKPLYKYAFFCLAAFMS